MLRSFVRANDRLICRSSKQVLQPRLSRPLPFRQYAMSFTATQQVSCTHHWKNREAGLHHVPWQYTKPLHDNEFSSELIPLYTSFPPSHAINRRIGIRSLTTDSKKPIPVDDPSSSVKESPVKQESSPLSDVKGALSSDPQMPEGGRGPVYKGFVDTMDTTLKRVNKWNTGDLMSVYGIIALIGVIVAAPIVVR